MKREQGANEIKKQMESRLISVYSVISHHLIPPQTLLVRTITRERDAECVGMRRIGNWMVLPTLRRYGGYYSAYYWHPHTYGIAA